MSYSFTARGATREEAKANAEVEFDKVVASQPVHAKDKAAAMANVSAVVDLLTDVVPEGCVVGISCNGYVSWQREDELIGASVSASANYFNPGA